MRSLIAIFLLATIYGFFVFRSPWIRLLLMALALPFSVLGNLARMLLIIVAAEIGGQSWGNYVHEGGPLGIISLVPYLPAMVGLLLVGRGWTRNKIMSGRTDNWMNGLLDCRWVRHSSPSTAQSKKGCAHDKTKVDFIFGRAGIDRRNRRPAGAAKHHPRLGNPGIFGRRFPAAPTVWR